MRGVLASAQPRHKPVSSTPTQRLSMPALRSFSGLWVLLAIRQKARGVIAIRPLLRCVRLSNCLLDDDVETVGNRD